MTLLILVQDFVYKHPQPREVNRFRKTGHQSETRSLLFTAFHVPSTHHNNGDMRLSASQLLDELEPIDAWHHHIHNNGLVVSRMRQYQSRGGGISHVHFHTLTSQRESQAISQRR
jgi:hypothetical protein